LSLEALSCPLWLLGGARAQIAAVGDSRTVDAEHVSEHADESRVDLVPVVGLDEIDDHGGAVQGVRFSARHAAAGRDLDAEGLDTVTGLEFEEVVGLLGRRRHAVDDIDALAGVLHGEVRDVKQCVQSLTPSAECGNADVS
jgi:hypothetical protein